jgi:hypothetical protein
MASTVEVTAYWRILKIHKATKAGRNCVQNYIKPFFYGTRMFDDDGKLQHHRACSLCKSLIEG